MTTTSPTYAGIGARDTPAEILAEMTVLAHGLRARGWWCRSGGARGADRAFEAGAGPNVVVRRPWPRPRAEAYEIAECHHPAWGRCDDRTRSLLARNVAILLGEELVAPVRFVLYWRDETLTRGGTLHALKVAGTYDIPAFSVAAGRREVLRSIGFLLG